MGFSPAVGILHSSFPRGSPSPPAVSGDDVRVYHLFLKIKLKKYYLWRQGVARFARCLQRYKLKLEKINTS